MAGLEEFLKLQGEELSSLRVKHLKMEEDHSRASSELAELCRRSKEEFEGIAAASADIAMRVHETLTRRLSLLGFSGGPAVQDLWSSLGSDEKSGVFLMYTSVDEDA